MGGGRRFHYPKWVWSPAGGWWANPTYWKRNTAIYTTVVLALSVPVYYHVESKTTVYKRKYVVREKEEDSHHHNHH